MKRDIQLINLLACDATDYTPTCSDCGGTIFLVQRYGDYEHTQHVCQTCGAAYIRYLMHPSFEQLPTDENPLDTMPFGVVS